jgi:hypothetical protein
MPESNDLAGLTDPEHWARGEAAIVLCEGCGAIQVDPDGWCLGDCEPYLHQPSHVCAHCTLVQLFGHGRIGDAGVDWTRRCHFHTHRTGGDIDGTKRP